MVASWAGPPAVSPPDFKDEELGKFSLGLGLHKSFTAMPSLHSQRLLLDIFLGTSILDDSQAGGWGSTLGITAQGVGLGLGRVGI